MSEKIFGFDLAKKWDFENGYYLTSGLERLPKALAHYELYKSIVHLPGHIIEFGVFKGASFIRLSTYREILESPYSRRIIGFDAFGKFPLLGDDQDQDYIRRFEESSGEGIPLAQLNKALKHKGFKNYELIEGDITETLPKYIEEHPELKISLLHIDVDVYKPTLSILSCLYERVTNGGVIVLDDYGTVPGETRAVDEFFQAKNKPIEKLPISHVPAFIRK